MVTTINNGSQAVGQSPSCSWTAPAATAATTATDDDKDAKGAIATNSTSDNDELYKTSSAIFCPPLVKLQVYGFCCPFIETEEEHDARIGVTNLQHYPITWYRKKLVSDVANDVKGAVPNASGLIDGIGALFSSSGNNSSSTNNNKHKKHGGDGTSIPMTYVGVPATLTVVDTDDHGPIIQIRALEGFNDPTNAAAQKAVNEYVTTGKPWWEDPTIRDGDPTKVIPLYMVDKVASSWSLTNDATAGGVKLYAAPPTKGFLMSGSGPELLRFDTLGGGGNALAWNDNVKPNEPNKYSDKIIVQLKSLVDWNRRRMARDIKHGRVGVAPKSSNTSMSSPGYVAMT